MIYLYYSIHNGILHQFSLVAQSRLTLRPHGLQHARPPCPLPTPRVHPDPCPLSWWCHPTTSSSITASSFCLQSFPASGFFPLSQLFTSCGQSIGASLSASVLPVNIQDSFPLGLTCSFSLQSKGLSRVYSSTTVQKHQFSGSWASLVGTQPSLWFNSHIYTWLLENHSFDEMDLCQQSNVSAF